MHNNNHAIRHEHGRYHPMGFPGSAPKPDDNWPYQHKPHSGIDPQYAIKNPKFERHIFIRRDQILYDIDAQLSMMAQARRTQDGADDERLTSATERYAAMFNRWIDTHIGIAKGVMSAFVLERFIDTDIDTIHSDVEESDITLLVPEWYDDTVFMQLTDAVHEYITNAALHDFLVVTLTSRDPVTVDKAAASADALSRVRKYVNAAKPGRLHKPYKPFG